MSTATIESCIDAYLEHIRQDYQAWGKNTTDLSDPIKAKVREEMVDSFNKGLRIDRGSKYIKVVSGTGVHTFIVVKPCAKFAAGDILKAASWAAPARNFKRGNILTGDYGNVSWTGAH